MGGPASTCSTVTGLRRNARGLSTAHSRCATTTSARSRLLIPRSCRKRCAGTVNVAYGASAPNGASNWPCAEAGFAR